MFETESQLEPNIEEDPGEHVHISPTFFIFYFQIILKVVDSSFHHVSLHIFVSVQIQI